MDSPGALNLISFMILIRKSYAATGTLLDKACHVNCGINLTFCPSTLLVVNPRLPVRLVQVRSRSLGQKLARHFISSLLNRNDDLKSKFAFARIGGDSGGIGRHAASDVTTGALGLIVRNLDLTKE